MNETNDFPEIPIEHADAEDDEHMALLRQIRALHLVNILPATLDEEKPNIEWVNPRDLWVEEKYQRSLSERSITLIRQIVTSFSWRKYKLPVVVRTTDNRMVVVDGQHTCFGCASHPEIHEIPVLLVSADDIRLRAQAFVAHNKNRINVTPVQMFFAALAAEDERALVVKRACDKAGVTVLRYVPPKGFGVGETVAIQAIERLVERRGPFGARQILSVLVRGGYGPILAQHLKAIEFLMYTEPYFSNIDQNTQDNLVAVVMRLYDEIEDKSKQRALDEKIPQWKATALIYYEALIEGRS